MKGTIFFFQIWFSLKEKLETTHCSYRLRHSAVSDFRQNIFFFISKNLRNFKEIKDTDKFKDRNDLRFECSLLIAEALFLKNIA